MCGERAKPQGGASGSVHDLLSLDALGLGQLASADFGIRTANIFTPPWNRPRAITS